MSQCNFCCIDKSKIYNTLIEETNNFIVIPSLGSLVDGYILIVAKKHLYNMFELDNNLLLEYYGLIDKYRNIFKNIYKKFPIVFEHGSNKVDKNTASSLVHAHTHIVNHNFKKEVDLLENLNFKIINDNKIEDKSYIFYISPNNKRYITYTFDSISQLMRLYIARDLKLENYYNWRNNIFYENIIKTLKNIKNY